MTDDRIAALSATPAPSDQDASQAQGEGLAERIRAAVTYQYMPMAVRKLLSEAAKAISRTSGTTAQDTVGALREIDNMPHYWPIREAQKVASRALAALSPAPGATAQDGAERAVAIGREMDAEDGGYPTPTIPAGMVARKPDYEAAWREMYDALSWMHGCKGLSGYVGWPLGKIATDLIDRAYPGLRKNEQI